MNADLFRKLAALGLSTDQIAGVLEIMDGEAEERKEKGRARWRKWKDGQPTNVSKRLPTTANVSSQLTRADPLPSTSIHTENKEEKKASPSAQRRGERIPDDFAPDIEAAVSEGLSRQDAEREARTFVDYWRARPGKEALKLDWPATWRVWFRKRLEKPPISSPRAPPRAARENAVDALLARRMQRNEPASGSCYYGDAELLPPDKPELQRLVGDLGKALSWDDKSGHR